MADHCDNGFKQKAVIEFLVFEGNAAKEISERLKNVYKECALSYASVRRWVTHFKSGSSSVTDKPLTCHWQRYWQGDDNGFLGSSRPCFHWLSSEGGNSKFTSISRHTEKISSCYSCETTQYAERHSAPRQCATAHCSHHHSRDCCKGMDSTATSSIQSRSGTIRFSHVWTSEGLLERPEVRRRRCSEDSGEGVVQTVLAELLLKRIYKLEKPMGEVCCAQWWLYRKIMDIQM